MNNDVNDPLFDSEPPSMAARVVPPLILICALGGFVALAIYAYRAGTQSVGDGELVVIEAEATPMKEKPEDPGGMQFPNQDKTIFETFSSGEKPAAVERVLPTPEEPIAQPADASGAGWVNEKLNPATPQSPAVAQPPGSEQVFGDEDSLPKPVQPQVMNVQQELAKQETAPVVEEVAKPVDLTPKNVVKDMPKPVVAEPAKQDVQEVSVAEVATQAKPVAEKPVAEKPVVKPEVKKEVAKPKASIGKQLVQLGAYKSESEAKGDFAKLQKKHPALSGKSPVVNRADLGDKGIFFRLRVSTDDAKSLCSKLAASGQGCMVVK